MSETKVTTATYPKGFVPVVRRDGKVVPTADADIHVIVTAGQPPTVLSRAEVAGQIGQALDRGELLWAAHGIPGEDTKT
ncbi:MAG: hypothetical protein ACYDAE_00285 [Steroidobacteraceae bacterium]